MSSWVCRRRLSYVRSPTDSTTSVLYCRSRRTGINPGYQLRTRCCAFRASTSTSNSKASVQRSLQTLRSSPRAQGRSLSPTSSKSSSQPSPTPAFLFLLPIRDSLGALAACARVCKVWNTLATSYLYRHIILPNRGSAWNTTTDLLSSLRSNSNLKPFIQTLHHPILKTVSLRERCLSSKLHLLLLPTFYPSLTILRGLVFDPFNISILAVLSRHAPSLRELSLEVTFASHERNTAAFQNARGIGTIDLPVSLERLSLSMDVGLSFSQHILKRLVETGESTLGGGMVLRNLSNLRRLYIEFIVHGTAGDHASPFARDVGLPGLRRLLTQFGSSLTHLGLMEKHSDGTRELYDAASLPLHSLLDCPSVRILAVDGLRLEPLLLAPQPYGTLEQLDIGILNPSHQVEDELSFGCGWFDPGATRASTRDGAVLRELVESFERSRFPRLRRVRLTCEDWRFEKHRKLRGLKEKVRAFRFMGLELVDFEGRVWWE